MGPTFTEGAIVQHLAKLRGLMERYHIPVPPPLKRGMVTRSPSKIYGTSGKPRVKLEHVAPLFPNGTTAVRVKQEDGAEEQQLSIYDRAQRATNRLLDANDEDPAEKSPRKKAAPKMGPAASPGKGKGVRKSKANMGNLSDDEEEEIPELYDSDSEYGSPTKKKRRTAKVKKRASAMATEEVDAEPATAQAGEEEGVAIKIEEEESGPAARTRGVKRDYSQMTAASSDEAEPEQVEQEMDSRMAIDGADDPSVDAGAVADGAVNVEQNASTDHEDDEEVEDQDGDVDADSEAETEMIDSNGATATIPDQPLLSTTVSVPFGQISVDSSMAVSGRSLVPRPQLLTNDRLWWLSVIETPITDSAASAMLVTTTAFPSVTSITRTSPP
jgi:hypothetical protein